MKFLTKFDILTPSGRNEGGHAILAEHRHGFAWRGRLQSYDRKGPVSFKWLSPVFTDVSRAAAYAEHKFGHCMANQEYAHHLY